ncbi:unnamed protein product [Brassica oleracea]
MLRNMKVIAQLQGSEELWEVAKLHNRESFFPEGTVTDGVEKMVRTLTQNTDAIPLLLLDLVDKFDSQPEARNQCRGPLEDKGSISSKGNRSLQWQWLLPR